MMRSKGERGSRASHAGEEEGGAEALHSMLTGEYTEESTDARTIRQTGGKDRHSKVFTSRGPRDRRVRLSVGTAIRFYDLQDRLGFEQPSKAVEWLLLHCQPSIKALPSLDFHVRNAALPVQPGYLGDLHPPQPHIPANKEFKVSHEDCTYFSPIIGNHRSGQNAHHEEFRAQALNSEYNQRTHTQIFTDHDLDTALPLYDSHPRVSTEEDPSVHFSIPSSLSWGNSDHRVSTSIVSQLQSLDAATASTQAMLTFPSHANFNLGAHNLTSVPVRFCISKPRRRMQSLPICFSPDGDAQGGDFATFRSDGNAAGTGRTMARSDCVLSTNTAVMSRATPTNYYSSLISNAPRTSKENDLLMTSSMDTADIAQLQQRLVAETDTIAINDTLMPFQDVVAGDDHSLSTVLSGNVDDTAMTKLYEKMVPAYRNNPIDVSPREANNNFGAGAAARAAYNSKELNNLYRQAFDYT